MSNATATDFAREMLLESVPAEHIGAPIDVVAEPSEDPSVAIASHTFECKSPSYPGWYWAVTVVTFDGQVEPTVSEINLLPGGEALVPPAWKPWAERVEPGDLGVGDLLPPDANDPRLTAGFTGVDELAEELQEVNPVAWELGLGREKILSPQGLEQAIDRWYAGDNGPRSSMAKSAPAQCSTCGFLTTIGGSLGQAFGVCANEFGAADGRIVAMNFGCGAHSSVKAQDRAPVPVIGLVIDDVSDDLADGSNLPDYVADSTPEHETYDHNSDADLAVANPEEEFIEAAIIDAIEAIDDESEIEDASEFEGVDETPADEED